jgi:hypothetical protein
VGSTGSWFCLCFLCIFVCFDFIVLGIARVYTGVFLIFVLLKQLTFFGLIGIVVDMFWVLNMGGQVTDGI